MNILLTALLTLALPFAVTKEDLRKLLDAGVGDQVIVEYIRSNGPAEPLSVEDVTELKKAGASDSVLRAMLDASRTSEAMTPTAPKSTTPPSDNYSYSYSYSYPSYSYSYAPYYYPYSYPYFSYSYYPRSYYYPYRYPYTSYRYYPYNYSSHYHNYNHNYHNYQNYHHGYTRPGYTGVSPYRNAHPQTARPQTVQPRQGTGTYRR